jgi:hypothetical protein
LAEKAGSTRSVTGGFATGHFIEVKDQNGRRSGRAEIYCAEILQNAVKRTKAERIGTILDVGREI